MEPTVCTPPLTKVPAGKGSAPLSPLPLEVQRILENGMRVARGVGQGRRHRGRDLRGGGRAAGGAIKAADVELARARCNRCSRPNSSAPPCCWSSSPAPCRCRPRRGHRHRYGVDRGVVLGLAAVDVVVREAADAHLQVDRQRRGRVESDGVGRAGPAPPEQSAPTNARRSPPADAASRAAGISCAR